MQDPEEALIPGMPQSALRHVEVDHRLPADEIGPLLSSLARQPSEEKGLYPVPDDMEFESKIAGLDPTVIDSNEHPGELAAFSCPECKQSAARTKLGLTKAIHPSAWNRRPRKSLSASCIVPVLYPRAFRTRVGPIYTSRSALIWELIALHSCAQ